jgi:formyl-CoA transferase
VATQAEQDEIFAGVRVLEIGQYIAAPVAARMMSDLGASVEDRASAVRRRCCACSRGPGRRGTAYIGERASGGCIDLGAARASGAARPGQHSDVLIENFTPGVMAKSVSLTKHKPLNPR